MVIVLLCLFSGPLCLKPECLFLLLKCSSLFYCWFFIYSTVCVTVITAFLGIFLVLHQLLWGLCSLNSNGGSSNSPPFGWSSVRIPFTIKKSHTFGSALERERWVVLLVWQFNIPRITGWSFRTDFKANGQLVCRRQRTARKSSDKESRGHLKCETELGKILLCLVWTMVCWPLLSTARCTQNFAFHI